jgi:hypothetical protein
LGDLFKTEREILVAIYVQRCDAVCRKLSEPSRRLKKDVREQKKRGE